jgi:hypothetical protein
MILIHINPTRVEKIQFTATNRTEEDFDFAAWIAIRPLVERIDRQLDRTLNMLKNTERSKKARR